MLTFDADIAAAELADKEAEKMAQKKEEALDEVESIEITDSDDQCR